MDIRLKKLRVLTLQFVFKTYFEERNIFEPSLKLLGSFISAAILAAILPGGFSEQ